MYRQSLDNHDLSIEQDTDRVPSDGYYYVLFEGEVVARFKSLNKERAHTQLKFSRLRPER